MTRLAVIGLGLRSATMLVELQKADPSVELTHVVDPDPERVRERTAVTGLQIPSGTHWHPDVAALLPALRGVDGIVIGTPCVSHTPVAVAVAASGLPVFLEKPVAVTHEQLAELAVAYRGRFDSVVVSFPLRVTPMLARVVEIVRSGRLGVVNQIQGFNYVSYGGVYFADWYRDYELAHGLWLQKATHDFDYLTLLAGSTPEAVAATETQLVYGGSMPFELRCSGCDRTATCRESPQHLQARGDGGGMDPTDHWCAFSAGIRNHDAGSALVRYADGAHVSYSQNFLTRRSALRRGAIVTGYDATLDFDYYTGEIRIHDHLDASRDEVISVSAGADMHLGGDAALARMFLDVVSGRGKSTCTLADGLRSVAMCLAAKDSVESGRFEPVRSLQELEAGS